MRLTKLSQKGKFDPNVHVRLGKAAERFGFSRKYFSTKIAKAYRIPKYYNGFEMFFAKADLDRLEKQLARRTNADGKHMPGKLPRTKIRQKSSRVVRANTPSPVEVEVAVTPSMLTELLRQGNRIKLVLTK